MEELIIYPQLIEFFQKLHESKGCMLVGSDIEEYGDCRLKCFDCLVQAIKQDLYEKSL